MTDRFDKMRENDTAKPGSDATQQFLTFTVGSEEYGVDIMLVREIKGWTDTTRLPNSPDYMRGVMNLRGLIIPIFDLRTRFSLGITEATAKHVVIILAVGERNIGLLVDTVSDILDATAEQIKPAPATETQVDASYINGLISFDGQSAYANTTARQPSHDGASRAEAAEQRRMVVLLKVDRLFDAEIAALPQSDAEQAA